MLPKHLTSYASETWAVSCQTLSGGALAQIIRMKFSLTTVECDALATLKYEQFHSYNFINVYHSDVNVLMLETSAHAPFLNLIQGCILIYLTQNI